jgi:glycosyltransferase involved in cell wall biosynthesis
MKNTQEIRLFSIVKNEAARIPFFISYYQSLGVDKFIFIDNGSTDNTVTLIKTYKNTYCLQTNAKYSYVTTQLINVVLEKYGRNHFCLVVDADETLIFGDPGELTLRDLAQYAIVTGADTYRAYLLDIYSDQPLSKTNVPLGSNPLEYCAFFDIKPKFTWKKDIEGGMRSRVFDLPTVSLTKNPFFFNNGKRITWGTHTIYPKKYADISLVLLHSKYVASFPAQVELEAKRKQHWNQAAEYVQYQKKASLGSLILKNEESTKYANYQQLIKLGLAKRSLRFWLYRKMPTLF